MKPTYSEWIPAVVHCPRTNGWYEVRHPKGSWIDGQHYALFVADPSMPLGGKWERALGWISAGNELAWTFDSRGKLIVAKPLNVFQAVEPTEWRGVL
jgi:hypothetical protein